MAILFTDDVIKVRQQASNTDFIGFFLSHALKNIQFPIILLPEVGLSISWLFLPPLPFKKA